MTGLVYYKIMNNPGVALPSTGGPGTNLIYLLGLTLTGLAGTFLLKWKNRESPHSMAVLVGRTDE